MEVLNLNVAREAVEIAVRAFGRLAAVLEVHSAVAADLEQNWSFETVYSTALVADFDERKRLDSSSVGLIAY